MGIRVHKQLGYGITNLALPTDPRFDKDAWREMREAHPIRD